MRFNCFLIVFDQFFQVRSSFPVVYFKVMVVNGLLLYGVSEINSKPDSMVTVIVLMSTCKLPCAGLINR